MRVPLLIAPGLRVRKHLSQRLKPLLIILQHGSLPQQEGFNFSCSHVSYPFLGPPLCHSVIVSQLHSFQATAFAKALSRNNKGNTRCAEEKRLFLPIAKQYSYSDYSTTSSHAARHARKPTDRKDAVCPDCKKAFSRKDNMEKHQLTHQRGE
jgi:hypothetical protein